MRLGGARTGKRAVVLEGLELDGLTDPFDPELWFGERVARRRAERRRQEPLPAPARRRTRSAITASWRLGADVVPGFFSQTHEHPELAGRTLAEILHEPTTDARGPAMGSLRRYELQGCADQTVRDAVGRPAGALPDPAARARGATLLLLDEPTDNLDLVSAEALEDGLAEFEGTVIAVTHDRWFMRGFDRFLVFGDDCTVTDHLEPPAEVLGR